MPTVIPAIAPRAVARRQIRPPKKAGASCATAAKDKQADRGELRVAGQPVIHVGEEQDDEDRDPAHRQQQPADIVARR